jgi:hypothetical protein
MTTSLTYAGATVLGFNLTGWGITHATGAFTGWTTLVVIVGMGMSMIGSFLWFVMLFALIPDFERPLLWFAGAMALYFGPQGLAHAGIHLHVPALKEVPWWAGSAMEFVGLGYFAVVALSFRQIMKQGA